jgi:hypothetical protein
LKDLFVVSHPLKRVEEHSKNLSAIETMGLEGQIESGNERQPWLNEKPGVLKTASQAYGEAELCVISEIESVLKQQMVPLPAIYPIF